MPGKLARCLKCNIEVIRIPKDQLEGKVSPRTFEGMEEYYLCPRCNNIYWNGTHYGNTLKKLEGIFNPVR